VPIVSLGGLGFTCLSNISGTKDDGSPYRSARRTGRTTRQTAATMATLALLLIRRVGESSKSSLASLALETLAAILADNFCAIKAVYTCVAVTVSQPSFCCAPSQ
jgi:hypothetical protein